MKLGLFHLFIFLESLYVLIGQYREQYSNIAMRNIDVGSKYLDILQDHCITKAHSKEAYIVDEYHLTGAVSGFDVAGRV